jgi:hypothetical protein
MSETNPIVAALQVAFESAVQVAVEQRLAPLAARLAALEAVQVPHVQRLIFNDDELRQLAAHVNLAALAAEISPSELVSNVDWSEVLDYADLASEVDLSDLAGEFNVERIAEQMDIGNKVRDYLADTMFNIREA